MRSLVLSAGHGAGDPGAVYRGPNHSLIEHEICAQLCWYVVGFAAEAHLSIHVMPPTTLGEKIGLANEKSQALAVEIHCNSSTSDRARGIEVYHYPRNRYTREAAKHICDVVSNRMNIPSRGPRTPRQSARGRLAWIEDTRGPALLIEAGFLSNAEDRKILTNSAGLASLGQSIAMALQDVLEV